ncbi:trypsin-like peptidase domain-containing protein [Alisedimentitalea sp. MJ-SS2]|uniref:trypsin-like peptidase domain-containing protein n=1 Tax=Aliisedimentitalea sp. MJ-SS2 TaxID=3049795 RepID=UPI00290CDCA8|nr:trypsin-like peptidase domain-containing protein [Alisedimentitalea sp. MJ-SS2]MDU8926065.1 trypsin-like peptidase domain-containing protein [Alisedimentitalea sp. MJ-SS2]
MTKYILAAILAVLFNVKTVFAQQDVVWVQVEALPSLTTAQDRVRAYAGRLADVNGFSLGGGWYSVVLGPYTPEDAQRVLQVYRAEREIPNDAFIAYSSSFQQQFWPVGANLLSLPDPLPDEITGDTATPETAVAQPDPEPADETPREARQSEAKLSRDEKKELQVMLQWAGHYQGAIDGAYGRGTRGSMSRWQEASNYEPTGVLTTKQRAELRNQYNAVLNGLDLKTMTDTTSGIEIQIPLGVVAFSKYSPPFAQFDATGNVPARVLLISQHGDQNTLYGLYDIMQTLEIVPESGPRERNKNSFTLTGEDGRIISHTEASLQDGQVKGFTLVWPAGDEERRTRLLGEMRKSFKRLDGAMDPATGDGDEQSIDLVSGLEIRRPKLSRSGFYVDNQGTVVTTAQAVEACEKITIDGDHEAQVIHADSAHGIAVLRATDTLAPAAIASLRQGDPRLQSEVAVSGFSYEGVLGSPTLTFGRLSDIKGLSGETELKRLALNALPGDAGGPVFDDGGAVMGMLLPAADGGRKLPEDVSFAMNSETLRAVLDAAGITAQGAEATGPIAPEDLTREARDMTVLVSCW